MTSKYPIGLQSFAKIREHGYIYVDKTEYIHQLVTTGKYYFLSRPRRFGKSLLLSTLESLFSGERDLFKGLAIDHMEWDWSQYEVLHVDFNGENYKVANALDNFFDNQLSEWERKYSIEEKKESIGWRFRQVIRKASEISGGNVVILIDEYDKPTLDVIPDEEKLTYNRDQLQAFYSVLKTMDSHIRFAMLTGVSRFSKVSVFSGANNLKDISLDSRYAAICGISESEVEKYFKTGIEELAAGLKTDYNGALALLKDNYDGYHFSAESPDMYNPFSLMNALDSRRISDYWFESGTPGFILRILKHENFYLPDLDCIDTIETYIGAKESYLNNPVSLLFETGYLTIKGYDDEKATYRLGMPNQEVASSFSKALMPIYSGFSNTECIDIFNKMRNALLDGEAEKFMQFLKTFLQGNPYGTTELSKRERYFQNNIYIVFRALGFLPRVEEQTCDARMDVMLRTRRFIYIFELKTDGSADDAMNQIDEKGYAGPYEYEGRRIIKIAANYSSAVNNLSAWIIK